MKEIEAVYRELIRREYITPSDIKHAFRSKKFIPLAKYCGNVIYMKEDGYYYAFCRGTDTWAKKFSENTKGVEFWFNPEWEPSTERVSGQRRKKKGEPSIKEYIEDFQKKALDRKLTAAILNLVSR